ncbi:MAG TPA: hypothetical protein VIZ68_04660 [Thermoplasmata archaeon]
MGASLPAGATLLVVPEGGPEPVADIDDRAFFETGPTGHFVLTRARVISRANSAAKKLFVPSGAELEGRAFSELIEPGSRFTVDQAFLGLAGPGTSAEKVLAVARGESGPPFPVELHLLRLAPNSPNRFGVVVRELGDRAPAAPAPATSASDPAPPTYTLGELLMANRLRELV